MSNHNMSQLNKSQLVKALILVGLVAGLTACGGGGSTSGAGGSSAAPAALGDTPTAPEDSAPADPTPADPAAPAADPSVDGGESGGGSGGGVPGGALAPGVVIPNPLGPAADLGVPRLDLTIGQVIPAHTTDKYDRAEAWTYHVNSILRTVTINTPDGDSFTGTVALDNSYTASGVSHSPALVGSCTGNIEIQGHLDNSLGIIGQYNDSGSCHVGPLPGTPYSYTRNIFKD